ncbi:dermonecrotic toxin domain-containing protein, partial [Pseudomonas graminis]
MPVTSAVSVFHLELGAFKARDILRIVDENGRKILYVCGAQRQFYCFDTHHQTYEWGKAQFLSIRTRAVFCARFLHSASDGETHRAAFQRDVAR